MRWSLRIARVSGIDIRVHITFLLIVLLGASQWREYGVRGIAFGVLLILLLFLCVTLHELGHSVVAQRFGITVRQIVLLPIGGIAMLSRMPSKPSQELLVAIAGPVVNVVIAVALALGIGINTAVGRVNPEQLLIEARGGEPSVTLLMLWLLSANVMLVLFNLIPAFPLDGGRMLRAILAMTMHPARATRLAAGVGQVMAVLLGMFGLMAGQFLLVLVAVFIFLAAGAESAEGMARTILQTRRVGDAYNKHALTLQPGDRLSTVIDHILTSYQPDFAVVGPRGPLAYGGGQLLGVITRGDVMTSLQANGRDVSVDEIMHREPLLVPATASLDEVRQALAEHEKRVAAVYDGQRYLGLVSAEDIAEAYAVLRFIDGTATQEREEGGVVV